MITDPTDFTAADLVTETDQAVETMVSTTLRSRYPSFKYRPHAANYPASRVLHSPSLTSIAPVQIPRRGDVPAWHGPDGGAHVCGGPD